MTGDTFSIRLTACMSADPEFTLSDVALTCYRVQAARQLLVSLYGSKRSCLARPSPALPFTCSWAEPTRRDRVGIHTYPAYCASKMALALALAAALLAAGRVDEPRYYVSSSRGSDANDGQTPSSAWQSLRRANQTTLPPGTQLLLRRGDVWTGEMLQLSVRGERGRPVRISAYGDIGAARPLIQRQNKTTDIAMLLDDPSFVVIDGLAVSTAKIGLYLRYCQSYGHKSVSVSNCTFDEIDDPVGLAAAFKPTAARPRDVCCKQDSISLLSLLPPACRNLTRTRWPGKVSLLAMMYPGLQESWWADSSRA